MEYIKGITFMGSTRGKYADKTAKKSLLNMKSDTKCNTVMLFIGALQDTPQSEIIDYKYELAPTDTEVEELIIYAKSIGLHIILQPIVNCKDGTWRAFINFFDRDVVCEPKWCNWFKSYTEFQIHYAKIAEKTGCDIFCIGSEMVMAERRVEEWKALIKEVRKVYSGKITYISDKYQEENVSWWSELDIIIGGGEYPIDSWEEQLDRIEKFVKKYNKPYIIGEVGCKSCIGASKQPNLWAYDGMPDMEEQTKYIKAVFEACQKRKFIKGVTLWYWNSYIYSRENALGDKSYSIYGKSVCNYISEKWK